MYKSLSGMMLAVALAATPAAFAQSTSSRVASADIVSGIFSESNISGRVYTGNLGNCQELVNQNPNLRFNWTLRTAYTDTDLRYAIKVQRPGQTCDTQSAGAESSENCTVVRSNQAVGSGTQFNIEIPARTLLGFTDESECEGLTANFDAMIVLPKGTTEAPTHEPDTLRVRLTTVRPSAPGAPTAVGGESSVLVQWASVADASSYVVYLSKGALSAGEAPENVSYDRRLAVTSGTSIRISSGLEVNADYTVAVTTMDKVGNESVLSATAQVSTKPSDDFWEQYIGSGGKEQGGYCQQAPLSLAGWLAAALGMLVLARATRKEGSKA